MGTDKNKLKELNNRFACLMAERFENWAEAQGIEPTLENYTKFLIGCSLVRNTDVNRFIVVDNYPKILEANEGRKMRTVYTLEDIVYIKARQIFTTLKHYSKQFRYNKKLVE